jgi:hypothetical protein
MLILAWYEAGINLVLVEGRLMPGIISGPLPGNTPYVIPDWYVLQDQHSYQHCMPQVVVYNSVQHWYRLHALFLLHASTSRIGSCPPEQSLTFLHQEFPLNCKNDNRQFHKNWLTRLSNRYTYIEVWILLVVD